MLSTLPQNLHFLQQQPLSSSKFCINFISSYKHLVLIQTMYSLGQHKYLPSFHHQSCTSNSLLYKARVYCTTTTTTNSKSRSGNKELAIEQRLVLPAPTAVAATNRLIESDPSLQSTWPHRAWVAAGCTTLLISIGQSTKIAADLHMWVEPIIAGYVGYILADLGSGIYHWGIDNYGDGSTPFVGSQIEAFQGHHKLPWTITKRQFANNLHALARAVTFTVLPINLVCHDPTVHAFVAMFASCIMFSQQFHAWAHGTKSRLPRLVVALQEAGVLVSRSQHGAHHRPPYNNNYCVVSGVWNELLDEHKVFEAMELILYFTLGVRPRSWSEPTSEWLEETEIPL
ncbi:putative B domain of TMEM189, localization domain-containing protein [Lupinus albus]|uniref:Putative B domain of TMEM189, localization domain-containing protein n=1 Tax=Lupinus albus TaxID=3870 RepID=A0A6A4QDH7_LUPAL|nr:putative B domain of TMEM189, localization domain-containing protein [Lupinus albus]